jgi:hypothetical protein
MSQDFSTRLLMAIVILVGVDLAILKWMWGTDFNPGIALVTLPTLNVLLLVHPRLRSVNETRSFWVGFDVVGCCMAIAFGFLAWARGAVFFQPTHLLYPWASISNQDTRFALMFTVVVLLYTPPQVLAAWIGGRMWARRRSFFVSR